MVVRELLTRLGFRVDQGGINIYYTTINNIRNSAREASNSVAGLFAAFAGLAALKGIAKTADDMQSLEARVGMLPQTVMSAADAFDIVGARASAAGGSINAYANFYLKLQNAGKDFVKTQEEGLQITDTITKALVVGGASAQERASALLQFGQAIGSGVLQGDELRAMSEAAPQFLDELAKAINIPRAELKKFASQGKLTSKLVIDGVKQMSSVFEERFKQMPMTIGTATTIVGNRWAMFINRLNRESHAVSSIGNFFVRMFDKVEDGLKNMVDFFGSATNTVKFFGIAIAAALAPAVFKFFAGSVLFLISPLGLLIEALLLVGLGIEDFYQWMKGGKSLFGQWFGNFDDAKKKLLEYKDTITAVKIGVVSAVALMGLHFIQLAATAAFAAGRTALVWALTFLEFGVAVVTNGVVIASWVVNTLARIAVLLVGWLFTFGQMAIAVIAATWPILLVVAAIAAVIAAVYFLWKNWDQVMKWVSESASTIWSKVSEGFGKMVDKIKGYWDSFKSFFGMGVSTTISAGTVAGAASASGGVPRSGGGGVNVTVNQELAPGTSQETAAAAREATMQAAPDSFAAMSRQMGQIQP